MKAPYDEQKAKQLLADGGWKDRTETVFWRKTGQRHHLRSIIRQQIRYVRR